MEHRRGVKPVCVEGELVEVALEARITKRQDKDFVRDVREINGLDNFGVAMKKNIGINDSRMARFGHSGSHERVQIDLVDFPPGSVIVFKFRYLNQILLVRFRSITMLLCFFPGFNLIKPMLPRA